MNTTTPATTCPKCLGAKYFPTFGHIEGGKCFTCAGTGVIDASKVKPARKIRPDPCFVPRAATPYAVVCTTPDAFGRCGGNMSLAEAERLCRSLRRLHGGNYAVIRHLDGPVWTERDGTQHNVG
jgi:hypothetical protein